MHFQTYLILQIHNYKKATKVNVTALTPTLQKRDTPSNVIGIVFYGPRIDKQSAINILRRIRHSHESINNTAINILRLIWHLYNSHELRPWSNRLRIRIWTWKPCSGPIFVFALIRNDESEHEWNHQRELSRDKERLSSQNCDSIQNWFVLIISLQ